MAVTMSGEEVSRRVVAEGVILRNWQDFLQIYSNKAELFNFLTKALFVTFYRDGKQLVISDGDSISTKPPLCDSLSLSPCPCEEANTRLLLHANIAAWCGHFKVLIRAVDMDVIVLAVCCSTTWSIQTMNSGLYFEQANISATWLPTNGYCTGNEKGPGTFHVSCSHWLWHRVQLCRAL